MFQNVGLTPLDNGSYIQYTPSIRLRNKKLFKHLGARYYVRDGDGGTRMVQCLTTCRLTTLLTGMPRMDWQTELRPRATSQKLQLRQQLRLQPCPHQCRRLTIS